MDVRRSIRRDRHGRHRYLLGPYQSEEERKASHVLAENIVGVRGIDDRRIFLDLTHSVV